MEPFLPLDKRFSSLKMKPYSFRVKFIFSIVEATLQLSSCWFCRRQLTLELEGYLLIYLFFSDWTSVLLWIESNFNLHQTQYFFAGETFQATKSSGDDRTVTPSFHYLLDKDEPFVILLSLLLLLNIISIVPTKLL